jgi:DNA-binding transcriptional LysR family regulator
MKPLCLGSLDRIKVVLSSEINTRRRSLETYFSSNDVKIHQLLELDAMFGTLDFVANTDWITILPAVMMKSDIREQGRLTITPLISPALSLDLVTIEPASKPARPAANAFLDSLREQMNGLDCGVVE